VIVSFVDIDGIDAHHCRLIILFIVITSVDTEMCCPKGKCGCQYFILLTLKKKFMDTGVLDFFLIKS
jgi:hypothetical protein